MRTRRATGTCREPCALASKRSRHILLGAVKRYTPSLESVWAEWHRRERLRKWRAERAARGIKPGPKIPPNSEPWLPHPPRSLDDLFYISEQVGQNAAAWKAEFKPSSET